MLKNLSIRNKLIFGLGSVLLLIFLVVGYAFSSIAELNKITTQQTKDVAITNDAYQLNITVLRFIVALKTYVEAPDTALLKELHSYRAQTYEQSSDLRRKLRSDTSINALNKFDELMPLRVQVANEIIESVNGNAGTDRSELLDKRNELDEVARAHLKKIIEHENSNLALSFKFTFAKRQEIVKHVIVAVSLVTIIIILISIRVGRLVTRPISLLVHATDKVAKGDFDIKLEKTSNDEVGKLTDAFNQMTHKLAESYRKIQQTSDSLEQQKELLKIIVDQLPVGVFLASYPDGKAILVNRAEIKHLGKSIDPNANKDQYTNVYKLQRQDGTPYPEAELPLVKTLKTGRKALKDDIIIKHPDGSKINVKVLTAPVRDRSGNIIYAVAITEDITKQKEIEYTKNEFISLASHQLRTPATAVKQFLGLIIEGYTKGEKEKNSLLHSAYDSNEEQLQIIEDILNVAKIESGKLALKQENVDLNNLVSSMVSQVEVSAKTHKHKLKVLLPKKPVIIVGDELKIKMSVQNILTNSIKYTPDGGKISVVLKSTDNKAIITISDNGIGISKKDQTKLFTKFSRIKNDYTIKVQGTGLGLYLMKQYIDLHKGKIKLTSEEGKGTTFEITFPK